MKKVLENLIEIFSNIDGLKNRLLNRSLNEDGLSILELVVAMGIILIITGSSIGVYNGINSNAKHASVEKAASDVLRAAMLFESDGMDDTNAQGAVDQWMKSQKGGEDGPIKVEIIPDEDGEIVIKAGYVDGSNISVSRSVNPNGSTCIDGILVGGKNTGDACVSGEKDPEIPGPAIGDTVSRLTYKCDADTTGYLAMSGIVGGTKITMAGSDGSNKLVKYSNKNYQELFDASAQRTAVISDKVTMKKNVKYTVVINGQFGRLLSPRDEDKTKEESLGNCLTKINKLGEDSAIFELSAFGLNNLTSVPASIPKSVTSLRNVFRGATIFNDPNVSEWDVSNVTTMYYGFGLTKEFNQPLNNWNIGKNTSLYAMFYSNRVFDQPLDNWNTGKVTNMSSMFTYNKVFNRDISEWDTSNVTEMRSMFNRTAFNKDISKWDVIKVKNFESMFYDASDFNSDISKWNTSSATNMKNMMSYATAFDKDLSGWNVEKVTDSTSFNTGGKLSAEKLPKFK